MMWTLLAGFLVMFMQAGFALVETGFTRAKNVAHTMTHELHGLRDRACSATGSAATRCRWAASARSRRSAARRGLNHEFTITLFGKTFGLFGTKGFFLSGDTYDVGVFALFLFQMVFMDTAATIPTGAMAERWKFVVRHLRVLPVDDRLSDLRQLGVGRRLALAAGRRTSVSATATSTSPARRSSTWSAAWRRSPAPWSSARASASTTRTARPTRCPATTCRWRCRHVHPGVRLVRLQRRVDRSPAPTCASPSSP